MPEKTNEEYEAEEQARKERVANWKKKIEGMQLSPEELARRWPRIQPIVRDKDGKPWFIDQDDPIGVAYTWDPKLKEPAPEDYVELTRERAYVKWGYYGFFKPSIQECLTSLPEEFVDACVAFEIVDSPKTADDLNKEKDMLNAGYQVCTVAFYARP